MLPLAAALTILQLAPASVDVPFRQPQLAASRNMVALAYGAGNSIYVATSTDEGRNFSKPSKVAEVGKLMLGRHRGPRVAISGDTIVVTAVSADSPKGDLLAWRSVDAGKTWSNGIRVNDVAAAAREGLQTLATDGHGKFFAAWLDLRKPGTRLYGASSNDFGATWSANIPLYESPDGTICQCCHPSTTVDAAGRIWVMWRNSVGGARDMYIASSTDGAHFLNPAKLGNGSWKINACPMDGGGLALDGGHVVTAWRREKELYLDVPGEAEQRVGEGMDISVAGGAKGVYAAWTSGGGISLHTPGSAQPTTIAEHGAFPNLLSLPGGTVLAAWENAGNIIVEPLP
jgi:hypothetical protein